MRVVSPLHAHLHAPFHTKMARLDFTEDSQFNNLLLSEAADLALSTVELLAGATRVDIDVRDRRKAAVDLLCWDEKHVGLLTQAAEQRGIDLVEDSLVPARVGGTDGWASLANTRIWEGEGLAILSSDAIAEFTPLLDPAFEAGRVRRFAALAETLSGEAPDPDDGEVAAWVEAIAKGLKGASLKIWNTFLSEVVSVFEERDARALQGRQILLDSERKLRRSGPWVSGHEDPVVFLPPVVAAGKRSEANDQPDESLIRVPGKLRRRIVFLHDGIRLRTRVGNTNERTPTLNLLTDSNLVEPFELASIVEHIRRLLDGDVADGTSQQALSWVYRQEQGSRSNVADLKRVGLRVPTRSGWRRADQAVFSPGWRTPLSKAVADLVAEAEDLVPTIKELGDSIILEPNDWPFKVKDVDSFVEFLKRAGVRDGLFPVPLRTPGAIRAHGGTYRPAWIAQRFGYGDEGEWERHVGQSWLGVAHPQTPYTGGDELFVVPGQEAFGALSAAAKDRLAGAVIESLGSWPDETFRYSFHRRSDHHRNKPDTQTWPSPARTFVERLAWFPMSDPRQREAEDWYFVPIAEGWTFDESTNEIAPRYARLAPKKYRMRLAASMQSSKRLMASGLRTWNSSGSAAARLAEIATLLADGVVTEADLSMVRRAYVSAWSDLLTLPGGAALQQKSLVVNRGPRLETVATSTAEPSTIYVNDVLPSLAAQVLHAGEFPVLVSDPAKGLAVATALEGHGNVAVRRTSTVEAMVLLDGDEVRPSETAGVRLVDAFGSWLPLVLLATIDLRSNRFSTITDQVMHRASAVSQRIRIVTGSDIRIKVDDRDVPAKGRLSEGVHVADNEHPLLVVNKGDLGMPSWPLLARIADDLADLIGQPDAGGEIRAAALALGEQLSEWRQPSDTELAKVLRCDPDEVTALLRSFRASTDQIRALLTPFVAVVAGVDAARRWDASDLASVDSLGERLSELAGPLVAARLLAAAEASESTADLWRRTGVDLGELNEALRAFGLRALHFSDFHDTAMRTHVAQAEEEILNRLRASYLDPFRKRTSLARYAAARSLREIAPDPTWLDDYETPDVVLLAKRVDDWLASHGSQNPGGEALLPLAEVQEKNRRLIDSFVPNASVAVLGWCHQNEVAAPDAWGSLSEVRQRLEDSGCLDFEVLDETAALGWFRALDLWPDGMDLSTDLELLELTSADIAAAAKEQETEAARRRRSRSEISFQNHAYDATTDDLDRLLDAVVATTDEAFLDTSTRRSKLSPLSTQRSDRDGPSDGGGSRTIDGTGKLSVVQTNAIGLLGERLAYEWLRRHYPEATPASWVSGNRQRALGGHAGDDTCGYDFEIVRKSGRLMFEVKASVTDGYAFDVGESELRAARSARKGTYRIIFINNLLDPEARRLWILPNPLEPEHGKYFTQVNQGVRLRFDPT